MDYIESYKREYLNQLSTLKSFKNSWNEWLPTITQVLSKNPTGQDIFHLGDSLSDVFQGKVDKGRSQSSVSTAGNAWECLVAWYLNLIFWGTPVLVIKKNKKFIPQIISNCTTVTIANNSTNSESDLVAFSVPDYESIYQADLKGLEEHLSARLSKVDLTIVQCKTNWNENSQIPMLWDLIYYSESRLTNVSVGVQGVSPASVKNFKYAFVSVPTSKKPKSTSIHVSRVKNLSGGNYWGHKTKADVASSINELPGRNYPSFFEGGVVRHLDTQLDNNPDMLHEFLSLKW